MQRGDSHGLTADEMERRRAAYEARVRENWLVRRARPTAIDDLTFRIGEVMASGRDVPRKQARAVRRALRRGRVAQLRRVVERLERAACDA